MSHHARFQRSPRPHRRGYAVLAAVVASLLVAADMPEIRRVKVPAATLPGLFPPGSELRSMPLAEFEDLARRAASGDQATLPGRPAKILRVRHEATLTGAMLQGRSELVVDRPEKRLELLKIAPWSQALQVPANPEQPVRSLLDGTTVLRVDPSGPSTFVLSWEARARPGSGGRVFPLGFPKVDASTLILDLPDSLVPDGPSGIRQGPAPGSRPDRRSWRFDGTGGATTVRLLQPDIPIGDRAEAAIWVGGATRIELTEAGAAWRADWVVEPGIEGRRRLLVELDAGLTVIDVEGPDVASYHMEPNGRLAVRLNDHLTGPCRVIIRASATVPDEGRWMIPSARAIDAIWTGGRTSLRVGPSRVLEDVRERSGRRVSARTEDQEGEERGGRLLVFEAAEPRSVAELTLRRATAEAAVEVQGRLLLDRGPPHYEAELIWKIARGRLLNLDLDLSPGWSVDRLVDLGSDESLAWEAESRPGGGNVLRIRSPSSIDVEGEVRLLLTATSENSSRIGPLALPRVRPSTATAGDEHQARLMIADERWTALVDADINVRPRSARGLAWIDQSLASPASPGSPQAEGNSLRESLAWRWNEPEGEAIIDRQQEAIRARAEAWSVVAVRPNSIRFDWYVAIDPLAAPLPITIVGDRGDPPAWVSYGREPGKPLLTVPGLELNLRKFGIHSTGSTATLLPQPGQSRGRVIVHASRESPWTGRATLPRLLLPSGLPRETRTILHVDPALLATIVTERVRALDSAISRSEFLNSFPTGQGNAPVLPSGRIHAFANAERDGRIELSTESLRPSLAAGVVEEATLTTLTAPDAAAINRLELRVVSATTRRLGFRLDEGATLERVLVDGSISRPIYAGAMLTVPLSDAAAQIVTVFYRLPAQNSVSRPKIPWLSLPCLTFRWTIELPPTTAAWSRDRSLLDADPPPAGPRANPLAGSISFGSRRPSSEIEPPIPDPGLDTETLGEFLVGWDGGPRPVLVDRDALKAANLHAGTMIPTLTGAKSSARNRLESAGLAILSIGDFWLVTTSSENPDRVGGTLRLPGGKESVEAALRAAAAFGSEPSGRFESAVRWRERADSTIGAFRSTGENPGQSGSRHFASVARPDDRWQVPLEEMRFRAARGLGAAASIVFLGIAAWRRPRLFRWGVIGTIAVTAAFVWWRSPVRLPGEATGALIGASLLFAFRLGKSLRRQQIAGIAMETTASNSALRSASASALPGLIILGWSAIGLSSADEATRREVILVLIPYDGPVDLDRPGTQAVLLLDDYRKLRGLAGLGQQIPAPLVAAVGAEHVLGDEEAGGFGVESRFPIEVEGSGEWSWPVPIGLARNLSATLDGNPVPLRIDPEGKWAIIEGNSPGVHECVVRRIVDRTRRDGLGVVEVPIVPIASARVRLPRSGVGNDASVATALGEVTGGQGNLGPADRLEFVLPGGVEKPDVDAASGIEGNILWDIEPAGDRLRARFVVERPEGVSNLRLRLEDGLLVRSVTSPSAIDTSRRGLEWLASFSPSLTRGDAVELDLWRPLDRSASTETRSATGSVREFPRIEPVESRNSRAKLGIRRPENWTVSFPTPAGASPIDEEAFVRDWQRPLEPGFAFVGAARLATDHGRISVAASPTPIQRIVRPTVRIDVQPGRLLVACEARLEDRLGHSYGIVAQMPPEMLLDRIEADGLTDWSRPSPDRLRLRFDGDAYGPRTIRIEGWIPTSGDPFAIAERPRTISTPWPTWLGSAVESGIILLDAPAASEASLTDLAVIEGPSRIDVPPKEHAVRRFYRIDPQGGPGRLRWTSEPPRISVGVRELLTIYPDTARLDAIVRYSVAGGPCDSIKLRLPSSWTGRMRLDVAGLSETKAEAGLGTTDWLLRFDKPVWGVKEIRLRVEIPLGDFSPFSFPQVTPLGRGVVETFLAIDDATGRGSVSRSISPGIQEVDPPRFEATGFPVLPGSKRSAYRVNDPTGTILIVPGTMRDESAEPTMIRWSDVEISIREDGIVAGVSRFELGERPGPYLALIVGEGIEPAAAEVDGAPTRPVITPSGRFLIPLPESGSRNVSFAWTSKSARMGPDGRRILHFPEPELADVPTLLEVHGPDPAEFAVSDSFGAMVASPVLEVERAERLGRRLISLLTKSETARRPTGESLLESFAQFQRQIRTADRSCRLAPIESPPRDGQDVRRDVFRRVEFVRASVEDAIASANIEELAHASSANPERKVAAEKNLAIAAPKGRPGAIRPPRIGRSRAFVGRSRGDLQSFLTMNMPNQPGKIAGIDDGTLNLAVALFLAACLFPTGWSSRRGRWLAMILIAALATPPALSSPWITLAILGSAASGLIRGMLIR